MEIVKKAEAKPKARKQAAEQVVDARQVLPQAEYKQRISKLKTSAHIKDFRSKFVRGK